MDSLHNDQTASIPTPVGGSFLSHILTPGSSLNPTFLVIVDGTFLCLFLVLLFLVYVTSGNVHIFALTGIELCLWGSVKWFVSELKSSQAASYAGESTEESKKDH